MKVFYNFISLVAVGNFNPAIVTPDFLRETCGLNLGEILESSPQEIPVVRNLKFKDLTFSVDYARLSIIENGIKDVHETKVLDIFKVYYEKLPYTPLNAVGVNINCKFALENGAKMDSLVEKVLTPKTYLDFFKYDKVDVNEKSSQTRSGKVWIGSNYRIENVQGLTRLINTAKTNNVVTVNYNYEAGNLNKDISRLSLLLKNYNIFCKEFLDFLKFLEV